MTPNPENAFTADDLEFLGRPLHGFFSAADGPTPPQPRPVWFEVADGTARLFSGADAVKVRRLRRDPRASLVVAAPVEERERWVAISGHTTIEPDGADDLCRRLAALYWGDTADRAQDLAGMLAADQVVIVLHPDKVSRFSY